MINNFKIVEPFGSKGKIVSKKEEYFFINEKGLLEHHEREVFNILINNQLVSDKWFNIYVIDINDEYKNCIIGFKNSSREIFYKQNFSSYLNDAGNLCSLYEYSYGVINSEGNFIIQPIYDRISRNSESSYTVYYDGKGGYVSSLDGSLITPVIFDNPKKFHDGLACIEYKGLTGYVSRNKIINNPDNDSEYGVKPQYEWGYDFENGYAQVKLDDYILVIDRDNNIISKYDIKKYYK